MILEVDEELDDLHNWHESSAEFTYDPSGDGAEILANFHEARKPLDQARTSRGFFPARQPNFRQELPVARVVRDPRRLSHRMLRNKICTRRSKKGHIAQLCLLRPGVQGGHSSSGFVGYNACEKGEAHMQPRHKECEG